MRLTVGPLPAAVYWRRRVVVLVGLAVVVLIASYACGGPSASNADGQKTPTPTASHFATATAIASASHTVPPPTTTPPATAFSLPTGAGSASCTDDEIELTAAAGSAQVQRGQAVEVTIKIRNASGRTCSRDVGADAQELRLQDASGIVWSSDDCSPRHGTDVRSFGAGQVASFTLSWNGSRSRTGAGAVNCTAGPPDAAVYDLVPRLDHKVGTPFSLRITAS
jgi:hypothetical protein